MAFDCTVHINHTYLAQSFHQWDKLLNPPLGGLLAESRRCCLSNPFLAPGLILCVRQSKPPMLIFGSSAHFDFETRKRSALR